MEKRNIPLIVKGLPRFPRHGSAHRWKQSVRQAAPSALELTASGYNRQMDVGRDDEMGCREGDRVMRGKIVPDVVGWGFGEVAAETWESEASH